MTLDRFRTRFVPRPFDNSQVFASTKVKKLSSLTVDNVVILSTVLSLVPTGFSRVLTERPHDVADVGDGDLAVAAVVVEQEGLLELGQLVFRELLLHPARHV